MNFPKDRSTPARRDGIIFADPGTPAVKEIGEHITHIAEADDGYAEDDVVVADAEVFPAFDPVLQNPALGGRCTVFRAVGTEIVQIEGCQGFAVDAETGPPIDADQGAFICCIHLSPFIWLKDLSVTRTDTESDIRLLYPYHNYRGNNINDNGLKSCTFFEIGDLSGVVA